MKRGVSFFFLILLISLLNACGGGGGEVASTGRATLTVTWPAPSRLIPAASNSIKIEIKNGANAVDNRILARPTAGGPATATFDPLPTGNLTATATAYPTTDATGVAQATATVPLTIQAGQNTTFSITMGSTIDHLELEPATVTLNRTQEQTLAIAAKNAANNIVLLSTAKLQWTSNATGVATVDATGKVRAVAGGTATITVTDTESNKSDTTTITVNAANPGGPVTLATPVTYAVPAASDQVIAGDFDGDGNADVVIGATELVILYGRGNGTLEPYQTLTTWNAGIAARDAADMNGDGRLDILCSAGPDKAFILYNTGGRSFSTPTQIPLGGGGLPRAGDINGDGRMDIAALVDTAFSQKSTVIFLNTGSGFTNTASYGAPQFAGGLTLGDLNGDGRLDIAEGFWSSTVGQGGIHTLIGQGNGTFTGGPGFTTGEPGNFPLIADFTDDGRVDLVVNNYWDHAIAVLPGSGSLNFGPVTTYQAAPYPLVMRAADFNRDGLLDIAAANAGSSHVTILLSQGSNGFGNTLNFEAGGSDVRSIALVDFNKDGKMDIVTQNQSNATVGVLLNTTP